MKQHMAGKTRMPDAAFRTLAPADFLREASKRSGATGTGPTWWTNDMHRFLRGRKGWSP